MAPVGVEPTRPEGTGFWIRRGCQLRQGAEAAALRGADDGHRTRDIHLGRVVLCQLSYVRNAPDCCARRGHSVSRVWRSRDDAPPAVFRLAFPTARLSARSHHCQVPLPVRPARRRLPPHRAVAAWVPPTAATGCRLAAGCCPRGALRARCVIGAIEFVCAPRRDRTPGPLSKSQLLYRLS